MAPIVQQPFETEEVPMSRTHQYRKVMKPLLERKRRARINKCLDDLKDLMVEALQAEGESITKLEKADVLELTVSHLQKLKRQQMLQANPQIDLDRYNAGYSAAATEVSRFLSTVPGINISFGTQLMSHLGKRVSSVPATSPLHINTMRPMSYPSSISPSSDGGYNSGRDSNSPVSVGAPSPVFKPVKSEAVWRPF